MIDALIMSCFQTAARANFGFFIECLGFGLNACDQKHVTAPVVMFGPKDNFDKPVKSHDETVL